MQGSDGRIRAKRDIRDCRRTIAAYAFAIESLEPDRQLLIRERRTEPTSDSSTPLSVVVRRAGCRVDAVTETAAYAEQFPVSPSRLSGDFGDEIRSGVEG